MYKRVLVIALALLSCQILFAQEEEWNWTGSTQDKPYRLELGPKVGAGLATLTDTFHNKWLVRSIIQPRLEYFFYLPFVHINTFSCRLFNVFYTLSTRLLVQRYTFSCIGKIL